MDGAKLCRLFSTLNSLSSGTASSGGREALPPAIGWKKEVILDSSVVLGTRMNVSADGGITCAVSVLIVA